MVVQLVPAPQHATDARAAFGQVQNVLNEGMFTANLNASKGELLQNPIASCLKHLLAKFRPHINASDGFNVSETAKKASKTKNINGALKLWTARNRRKLLSRIQHKVHVSSHRGSPVTTLALPIVCMQSESQIGVENGCHISSDINKAARVAIAGFLVRKAKNIGSYDSAVTRMTNGSITTTPHENSND
ncbi:unnamed protein product [Heligmosomoides polygyrus]|uniref:Calponin-homology (CH) domain-containing protein n=1 Tax=Heligmosomoides polygyrus TaxID=6339 RepID=A0A183FT95_HELPZ|nr:unnamed protein product [Heligmosomoides polygyrus]